MIRTWLRSCLGMMVWVTLVVGSAAAQGSNATHTLMGRIPVIATLEESTGILVSALIAVGNQTVVTDSEGNFIVKDLAAGDHLLDVWFGGRKVYSDTIHISDYVETLEIDLSIDELDNLLPNPDFHGAPGLPLGWKIVTIDRDTAGVRDRVYFEKHPEDDEKLVLVIDDVSTSYNYGLQTVRLPASPGLRYQLAAKVRTDKPGDGLTLRIEFFDRDGNWIGRSGRGVDLTESWREERSSRALAPDGTAYLEVSVFMSTTNVGRAYVRDLVLAIVD